MKPILQGFVLAAALTMAELATAGAVEDAVAEIKHDWEVVKYQTPAKEREKRFEALAAKAHQVSEAHPGRSEPLVWEGIVVSSWAGEKDFAGASLLPLPPYIPSIQDLESGIRFEKPSKPTRVPQILIFFCSGQIAS